MKYVVTAEEMRKLDQYTTDTIGIPSVVLMERAALAVRDRILEYIDSLGAPSKKTALILAGNGNNGADGLALARLLAVSGIEVEVVLAGDPTKATVLWKLQHEILKFYDLKMGTEPSNREYTVIVDALFGVGLCRTVTGSFAEYLEQLNLISGRKFAVDIPSGIDATTGEVLGTAFRADETITFAYRKRGLCLYPGCMYGGRILVADIGIPNAAAEAVSPEMFYLEEEPRKLLPGRAPYGNKGTFGKVLLVAGSSGMAGAAILAGRAAYGFGAGMVKIITVPENREIIQGALPEALFGTFEDLRDAIAWSDVIAIGPGLGRSENAHAMLEQVIAGSSLPLIIDADGLQLLAGDRRLWDMLKAQCAQGRPVAITPHPGELAGLMHTEVKDIIGSIIEVAKQLAEELGAVVVAKDARTVTIKRKEKLCMNLTGNSGMATAGSGDVLTGIIAALAAQGMELLKACYTGAYLHGFRGDMVSAKKGEHACMAGDLINFDWSEKQ